MVLAVLAFGEVGDFLVVGSDDRAVVEGGAVGELAKGVGFEVECPEVQAGAGAVGDEDGGFAG